MTSPFQVSDLIGASSVKYCERAEVRRARDDFKYICVNAGFSVQTYIDYLSIVRSSAKLADFLVVPFDTDTKVARLPMTAMETKVPKLFVAVICYAGGKPIDALLFNAALINKKPFKFDKKTGEYVLKIKDIKHPAMQKNAFGVVIGQLQ